MQVASEIAKLKREVQVIVQPAWVCSCNSMISLGWRSSGAPNSQRPPGSEVRAIALAFRDAVRMSPVEPDTRFRAIRLLAAGLLPSCPSLTKRLTTSSGRSIQPIS